MADKAKLTEHTGAKKGKGAYAGRKRDAKPESNTLRRRQSIQVIDDAFRDTRSETNDDQGADH